MYTDVSETRGGKREGESTLKTTRLASECLQYNKRLHAMPDHRSHTLIACFLTNQKDQVWKCNFQFVHINQRFQFLCYQIKAKVNHN